MVTADELHAFEEDIAEEFNAGKIRAPIHLSSGNEEELIRIFKHVHEADWICCSWRSHLHCLLKGVPPALLKQEIMAGRSISLCFPEYRVISSAIVGGIIPIGLGIAMRLKLTEMAGMVHVFMGDMTELTGVAQECMAFAGTRHLPIRFIVEDNGFSVCTPTHQAWGDRYGTPEIDRYEYRSKWPHAGAGKRVQF